MSDDLVFALLVAAPLVVFAVRNVRVAQRTVDAARRRPRYDTLTVTAGLVAAIAFLVVISAVIAIASSVYTFTGVRILPPPVPLLLLYFGIVGVSLAVRYFDRQIKRWSQTKPRRRRDDPPGGPA